MPKYRLIDDIDWSTLQGVRLQLDISDQYIIAKPLKAGASIIILAQAVKPRSKSNGQPSTEEVTPLAGHLGELP